MSVVLSPPGGRELEDESSPVRNVGTDLQVCPLWTGLKTCPYICPPFLLSREREQIFNSFLSPLEGES